MEFLRNVEITGILSGEIFSKWLKIQQKGLNFKTLLMTAPQELKPCNARASIRSVSGL